MAERLGGLQVDHQLDLGGLLISFDPSRPDGTPRKWLDVSRLGQLGWKARISLEDRIKMAYRAYLSEQKQAAE